MEASTQIVSASPVPSVRWNSLERQVGKLSTHHEQEQTGSSSRTSLLQIGGGGAGTSSTKALRSGSSSSELGQHQLQLLSVPQPNSPLEEDPGGEQQRSSGEGTSSRFRRYSCNPPSKGGLTSSPQPHLRRSSLAAIKWSVLARRISMGMAHEREPPQDPTQVSYRMHIYFRLFLPEKNNKMLILMFHYSRKTTLHNDNVR